MTERTLRNILAADFTVMTGGWKDGKCIKKGTSGESYNLMAKMTFLRYNTLIPIG